MDFMVRTNLRDDTSGINLKEVNFVVLSKKHKTRKKYSDKLSIYLWNVFEGSILEDEIKL